MYGQISVMNHLELTVDTHTTDSGSIRIVGFEVEAFSVNWGANACLQSKERLGPQIYDKDALVSYTYQIKFKKSDLLWAHRFDHYMKLGNDRIHHLQFLVSCLIAFMFSFCVYKILQRTLNKDLDRIVRNEVAL